VAHDWSIKFNKLFIQPSIYLSTIDALDSPAVNYCMLVWCKNKRRWRWLKYIITILLRAYPAIWTRNSGGFINFSRPSNSLCYVYNSVLGGICCRWPNAKTCSSPKNTRRYFKTFKRYAYNFYYVIWFKILKLWWFFYLIDDTVSLLFFNQHVATEL